MAIDQIVPNTWNPNRQSEYIYERELNSLKENGMLQPILVREFGGHYQIIDGYHRHRAAKDLNYTEVPVINMGVVEDVKAQILTVVMNEVKGKADDKLMGELLLAIEAGIGLEELLKNIPFTEDEFKLLTTTVEVDWDKLREETVRSVEDTQEQLKNLDEIIFQIKLKAELHDQLIYQLNRIKLQKYPGANPADVSNQEVFEILIDHIKKIPDDALLT